MGLARVAQYSDSQSHRASKTLLTIPLSLFPIMLLLVLYFSQIWRDVGGVTIRLEDMLIILLVLNLLLPPLLTLKFRYRRSLLNGPILLWMATILLAVLLTFLQPFSSVTKKDSLVNGLRLILALSLFFVMYNHPAKARDKLRLIVLVTIGFSYLTTAVSILQIGHWDGWLPLSLPSILTEKVAGANTQKGREIFGLFWGDTSGHAWAAMLAIQALTVYLWARVAPRGIRRWFWYGYFGLLTLVLLRTAVRNSLFGLLATLAVLGLLRVLQSRHRFNRLVLPVLLIVGILLLIAVVLYLPSDSYYILRARAAIPRIEGGEIVISGASSIFGRVEYAEIALQLFGQRPVTGYGFYSYQELSLLWSEIKIPHAHNSLLQILAEMGLAGALAFAWLIVRLVRFLLSLHREKTTDVYLALGKELLLGVMIYIGFTLLFANPVWDPRRMGFVALLVGAMASFLYEVRKGEARERT